MSLFNRITTWATNQLLKSTDLNGEFNGIINTLNNLDGATTTWTNVKATTATLTTAAITTISTSPAFSPTTNGIKGTTTNDNTSAGNVGEYVTSSLARASAVACTPTTTWVNVTTISLTAGDWDVTGETAFLLNGATQTVAEGAVSAVNSPSASDHVPGDNDLQTLPPTAAADVFTTVSAWRQSLSGTTTIYLKALCVFSAGGPKVYGRISARRVR